MTQISTDLEAAVDSLKSGNPVALPTETVYGLAADAENEDAIKAVFELKKRPLDHPLILHAAPEWDLSRWVKHIPDYARKLMHALWPGPLTLVFICHENNIPSSVRSGQNSVAVRCPNHPIFLKCLRQFGSPLVAPSANPFGKVSPTTAHHVSDSFKNTDLLIIDGGRCKVGIESTILDARSDEGYRILRHGVIEEQTINKLVDVSHVNLDTQLRVSGHLKAHYQPEKPLFTFETETQKEQLIDQYGEHLFLIDTKPHRTVEPNLFFKWPASPEAAAYELYYQLRAADKSKAKAIAICLPPQSQKWSAVRERIIKASHHSGRNRR